MNFTVRPASPKDLAAVESLLQRSYPRLLAADYPPSVIVTALPIISRARPELLTSRRYFLAVDESSRVLGAGGYSLGAPGPSNQRATGPRAVGIGHIRHVVTDDRHLRQGIARAIMERVFSEAEAEGVATLDCLATRTAVPFYAAMGFAVLGPVEVALRPGISFPAIRMQKALP